MKAEDLFAPFDGMTNAELIASTYREPYKSGDILYVRETFAWEPCWDCGMDTEEHNCCDESAHKIYNHKKHEYGCYTYKASVEDNVYPSVNTWHPSIHMPREVARIWLKVTDVRVERLQDMNGQDILREGVNCHVHPQADYFDGNQKMMFAELWNSTLKKTDLDRYGWDASPWVWVIEFERCEKPEPCIIRGIGPADDERPCIGYGVSEDDDEPCEMCKGCKVCSGYGEE